MPSDQSNMFQNNFIMFKIFGLWPGRTSSKYYKYYTFSYLIVTCLFYNILLTINLIYTPRKIDLLIREVIFYFTEFTVLAKIYAIVFKRDKLIEALNFIDCDEFVGDYENKDGVLYKTNMRYRLGSKFYIGLGHVAFTCSVFVPMGMYLIYQQSELPICNYYFLSDEVRESYFFIWFLYQSIGMYGHMLYNLNVDSLIAGLLVIAIDQLRLLQNEFSNLKLSEAERELAIDVKNQIQMTRLNKLLKRYEVILKYCETVQNVITVTMFFQFGVASIIICVVMCGLLNSSTTEYTIFLIIYLFTMTMQIFVPGFLGTQLTHESQELMTAAYSSEWIPRSESFKRSLKLFVQRAATPIVISGSRMFPLSLVTFIAIMKTAYSFFTLILNVQEG